MIGAASRGMTTAEEPTGRGGRVSLAAHWPGSSGVDITPRRDMRDTWLHSGLAAAGTP